MDKRYFAEMFSDEMFECPHCKTENRLDEGMYCKYCGRVLLNLCTNEDCENAQPSELGIDADAHYCPLCGAVSLFEESGYFV